MRLLKTVILSGLFIAIGACGAKNASDAAQGVENLKKANGNSAADSASYASACVSSTLPDVGPIKFPGTKTIYELSALTFRKIQAYYSDGNCTNEALIITESGKVVFNGTAQPNQPAQEDFNFEKTTVKLQTDTVVKAFNLLQICGFTKNEWAEGTDIDVGSQSNQATCPGKPSPRTAQELVLIQNLNLYLGANADQPMRPDHVDQSRVYTKQN